MTVLPLVATGLPGGPELGIILLRAVILFLLPFGAAVWVFRDATDRERKALAWSVVTFLAGPLFAVVVLLYVVTRRDTGEVFDPLGRYDT